MTHIISFVFGAILILFFMEMNVGQMKSHWQHAYQVGRDDGYTLVSDSTGKCLMVKQDNEFKKMVSVMSAVQES